MNILSFHGSITGNNMEEMRNRLVKALNCEPFTLTVDLCDVTCLDFPALATLMEAARVARGQGTRLFLLSGLQREHLLELTQVDHLLELNGQGANA
jgi:anti-anti-sigma regulatory factor